MSLRPWLARLCSADTMRRIVDPVLADMQFESERPAWRGYAALARALMLHAVVSSPARASRVWNEDERALPRGIVVCALAAVVLAAPLVAVPAKTALRVSPYVVAVLLPQALGLALPMSVLFAIPLAFRKALNRRRLLMRGAVLSAICATANVVVMIQMLPSANQAFRLEVYRQMEPGHGDIAPAPGPIEMTLRQLRDQIEAAHAAQDRLTPEGAATMRRLEYTYQVKLALCAVPIPLGLLAIAITCAAGGRPRAVAIGGAAAFAYVYGAWALDGWSVTLLRQSDAVSPAALAWTPGLLVMALALAIFPKSRARPVSRWA